MSIKHGITCNPCYASSVRSNASENIFTRLGRLHSPSLPSVRFHRGGLLCQPVGSRFGRKSEGDTIPVVGVVVVDSARGVHIPEVVHVVRRTEPPVVHLNQNAAARCFMATKYISPGLFSSLI